MGRSLGRGGREGGRERSAFHAERARANIERREASSSRRHMDDYHRGRTERERTATRRREQRESERFNRLRDSLSKAHDKTEKHSDESTVAPEAAEAGYATALSMCGNNGQQTIIEQMGYESFLSVAEEIEKSGDGDLSMYCSHPEAVTEILDEAQAVMEEIISEDQLEEALDESAEFDD